MTKLDFRNNWKTEIRLTMNFSNYKLHKNFRASASQALQKIVKKGRLIRNGSTYKINPDYVPPKVMAGTSRRIIIVVPETINLC